MNLRFILIKMSPIISGHEEEGIHKLIEKAIQGCEAATQETMWSNIVLSGGVCQFPGNNLKCFCVKCKIM